MKSAKPLDDLVVPVAKTTHRPVTQTGPVGFVAPALPQNAHNSSASVVVPDGSIVPPGSYSTFPYATVGKVFFTQNGNNFVCSGAAINSKNKSVVDAAGHCVYGGGHFDSYFQFCPQYLSGSSPKGCWVARYLATSNEWINNGSSEDDFGAAVVSPNGNGNLVDAVGGLGSVYNASANQTFTALGYPANSPYDGSKMIQCGPIGSSTVTGLDNGTVIAIPCDMHGGASGGPWVISFNGTFGYVNGHNDFHYTNDLQHEYTPYYDGDWFSVFNLAQSQ
jgi:V8-like Glu-specific endopeptidase